MGADLYCFCHARIPNTSNRVSQHTQAEQEEMELKKVTLLPPAKKMAHLILAPCREGPLGTTHGDEEEKLTLPIPVLVTFPTPPRLTPSLDPDLTPHREGNRPELIL